MTSKYIINYLESLKSSLDLIPQDSILKAYDLLMQLKERNGTVWTCGNGGSASLADHLAQDLSKQCGIRSIPLTSLAMVTALGNDLDYESIFRQQLVIYAKPTDLLVVVSGSGNSMNIRQALVYARAQKIPSIALLGFNGGKILERSLADLNLHIPANHMGRSEDGHLIISHILIYGLMESHASH